MELIEGIKTRRSIRKFTEQPVSKETIEKLVETAEFAPTWKNSQANRYKIVTNVEAKANIADNCVYGFAGNQNIIKNAPVLVVLTTVDGRSGYERDGSFSTSKGNHWQSFDAGIGAQTFCLAAHEAGLGTVIMGIYEEEKVIATLGIPEGESVSALIALGYPAESPEAPKRKELEKVLTFME